MKKTLTFETTDDCNLAREFWTGSVIDWDNVAKTVTVEADKDDIEYYLSNQFEIHGWTE